MYRGLYSSSLPQLHLRHVDWSPDKQSSCFVIRGALWQCVCLGYYVIVVLIGDGDGGIEFLLNSNLYLYGSINDRDAVPCG